MSAGVRRAMGGLLAAAWIVGACSAGQTHVEVRTATAEAAVDVVVGSEGKNTFSALGVSCEAPKGGSCVLRLPASSLQAGWNRVVVATKRRVAATIEARFFVGDELFPADCTVVPLALSPDPAEASFDVRCAFPPGFSGEIAGQPMTGGRAVVPALACVDAAAEPDLARPLVRGAVPLDVVNAAGGRLRQALPVAVPAPVVQIAIDGWATPWFERTVPLVIDAEPGATVLVDGTPVPATADGPRRVEHPIGRGANSVRVEARLPGHAPTVHVLPIEGRHPDTPLRLDQNYVSPVFTDRPRLPLSGRTAREARLYLGGRPLEHAGGRFATDAFLEEGKNEIELLAVVDAGQGQAAQPATKLQIVVYRDASPDERLAATLASLGGARPGSVSVADVGRDPWRHVGEALRFPMVVDRLAEDLSLDGRCTARLEGRACTQRVGGQVLLGWTVVEGWTCVGALVPVLVEGAACPDAREGDDVEVVGIVAGALGGRADGRTAERPRIDGLQVERLPSVELLAEERWPVELPALLVARRERERTR